MWAGKDGWLFHVADPSPLSSYPVKLDIFKLTKIKLLNCAVTEACTAQGWRWQRLEMSQYMYFRATVLLNKRITWSKF